MFPRNKATLWLAKSWLKAAGLVTVPDGNSVQTGIPSIAGQNYHYLRKTLRDMRQAAKQRLSASQTASTGVQSLVRSESQQ